MCQDFGGTSGKENKKRPLPIGRGLLLLYLRIFSAAARSGAAGAGTASAAANRVGGSDGETGTVTGLNKIHLDGSTGRKQIFFHKKGETVFLKGFVVVFWLIQSQSQGRACSAALHESNSNG
jgi:hypothetical protein